MSRRKVIITIAPTGGLGTKEMNPDLPTQPQEIADDVAKCCAAGASVVAVHARRPDDTATCDGDLYHDINTRIREQCDIIINNSTGGGPTGEMVEPSGVNGDLEMIWAERMKGVEGGAEICTHDAVTANTHYQGQNVLMRTPLNRSRELAQAMKDRGIKPEWECFSIGHMLDPITLIKEGLDEPPYIFNFVLGVQHGIQGAMPWSLKTLQAMVDELPDGSVFTVSGIGPAQLPAAMGALLTGGHVRVGLEDNMYYSRGQLATNMMLVERLVNQVDDMGFEPATAAEAREILGIPRPSALS
ncbi:MAG: 3-keto-5-aminohexanoate cleavage protein [Pseudomonadota bacterium]